MTQPPAQLPVRIERRTARSLERCDDLVAVEAPLEIRVRTHDQPMPGLAVSVTMRTPGQDEELAVGYLFSEGVIRSRADVLGTEGCGEQGQLVVVQLAASAQPLPGHLQRQAVMSSACGVCGKSSIAAVQQLIPTGKVGYRLTLSAASLRALPQLLAERQSIFSATGGLHAAALVSPAGTLLALREDVGRHNATDKLIGATLLDGGPAPDGCALLLSGRASFELLQKAAMAGIELVAAIGAPSSLAIELATQLGITLVGFLRPTGFNVYSAPQRIGP